MGKLNWNPYTYEPSMMHFPTRELLALAAQGMVCLAAPLLLLRAIKLTADGPISSLWMSLALVLPIALAAVGAYIAVGIEPVIAFLCACAVSCLLFGGGVAMLVTPRSQGVPPAAHSTLGGQVLALAILLLLVGFATHLTLGGMVAAGVIGLVSLDLLRGRQGLGVEAEEQPTVRPGRVVMGLVVAVIPAAVLLFASWRMVGLAERTLSAAPVEIALINLLCPAVLVPTIRYCTRAAATDRLPGAMQVCSAVAVITIALILPGIIGADYLLHGIHLEGSTLPHLNAITWRLDGSLLLLCGMALTAMRFDMLLPERSVAIVQVVLYGAYLVASTALRATQM